MQATGVCSQEKRRNAGVQEEMSKDMVLAAFELQSDPAAGAPENNFRQELDGCEPLAAAGEQVP